MSHDIPIFVDSPVGNLRHLAQLAAIEVTALAPNWSLRRTSLSAVPSRGPSHRRTSWRRPFLAPRKLEPEKVAYKML